MQRSQPNYTPLFEISYQYWLSQAIYIVTSLGIPELLQTKKLNTCELFYVFKEEFPGMSEDNLYRVLRNLSAVGLFNQDADNKFTLSSLGGGLLKPKIRQFIFANLNSQNWAVIAEFGKDGNVDNYDEVFSSLAPNMPEALADIVLGYRNSKAIYIFAKLGIADYLSENSLSANDLAKLTALDKTMVETFCETLAKKGVLDKKNNNQFCLTSTGKLLLKSNVHSLANFVLHENTAKWQAAAKLIEAVTANSQPFLSTHHYEFFDYLELIKKTDPNEFAVFGSAMAEVSHIENMAISAQLNISDKTKTIMDVGGGTGALMMELLNKNQTLRGIVFDLPETVEQIQNTEDRCNIAGGSFFDLNTIPDDADLILLKRTLHDWDNEKAVQILKNCAVKSKEVNVVEWLWTESQFVASADLSLMSIGGKIRSVVEFKSLMEKADIRFTESQELTDGMFAVKGLTERQLQHRNDKACYAAMSK
jgi:predicted transcriptional regulator